MADAELAKSLKDLPIRIQTASIKERREVVENVLSVLSHPNFTESIVRGLCKVLLLTLPRYNDVTSQSLIRKLVKALAQQHADASIKFMVPPLHDMAAKQKLTVAGSSPSAIALTSLSWTCILLKDGFSKLDATPAELSTLIDTQAILLFTISAGQNKKRLSKAVKSLNSVWEASPKLWKIISSYLTSGEPTDHGIIYGAHFLKYLYENKQADLVAELKPKLLDALVKITISCKKKPDPFILPASRGLLALISHEEFSSLIQPALEKAMLRSPEVILQNVAPLLAGLNLDLSQYALPLGKHLVTNLCAKEDQLRDEALEACRQLAKQCSDSGSLESLLDHLFAVLQGSQGKLTVATHKISVLQGGGCLSENGVTGSSVQGLAVGVLKHFFTVLENEVHEKTLVQALKNLAKWGARLTQVPQNLIDWFHKGIALKTSTTAVRTAYIDCMAQCFHGSTLHQAKSVLGLLTSALDRGYSGGPTVQLEALSAACLLLKLVATGDIPNEPSVASLKTNILDPKTQMFVNDKFLTTASDEGLMKVLELCERILLLEQDQPPETLAPVLRALLFNLTCAPAIVRNQARSIVKRLVSILGGTVLAIALINDFNIYLTTVNLASEDTSKNETTPVGATPEREATSHTLVDALVTLCSGSNLTEEDSYLIALAAILPAHNPILTKTSKALWLKLLKLLKLEPGKLIQLYKARIVRLVVQEFRPEPSLEAALSTLVRLDPTTLIPKVIDLVIPKLQDASKIIVTRDEYFTYLTPEGELYDKSVISGREHEQSTASMKRESKLYSFKDQMEELALRRELEEKKRREGKLKEPELTPKQKEQLRMQLEKESTLRAKLSQLNDKVMLCSSLISSAMKGDALSVSRHFKDLLPALIANLHSAVASPIVSKLYLTLGVACFPPQHSLLASLIGHVTLRVLKPQCDLDPTWELESLPSAVARTLEQLSSICVSKPISAPCFCYCFPFIRASMLDQLKNELFILTGIRIIGVHAQMRGKDDLDLYHPKLLPRHQILLLLIEVIDRGSSKKIQTEACTCLLVMCAGASGEPGTCRASPDEIHALLSALQTETTLVREAGLKGLTAMCGSFASIKEDYELRILLCRRVWVACNDPEEENIRLAKELWSRAELESVPKVLAECLMKDVVHPVRVVQEAAAKAIASLVRENTNLDLVGGILENLQKIYSEKLMMIPPKLDNLGRVTESPVDTWEPRSGVAMALQQLAPFLQTKMVSQLVSFFVTTGLADRKDEVRKNMLSAALTIVDIHGKDTVSSLLPVFEEFMDQAPNSGSYDAVRQSVVILMGSLARHLDKEDGRIKPIVERLIDALSTPSQQVQEAVANCLPPLVPAVKDDAPEMINKLLTRLLESENYGERKGAAYGLAGLVKGMGILVLKQLNIMNILTAAIQDKKNYRHREGALFAFEMLCTVLGRLFEPYIVHVLPFLLLCFGDSSQFVRDATDDTARVVMSKLSAHGVKLVLPSLLAALEEDSWRTKTGSVELLGAMAFCAPKQLSSCLPSIVPKLIEVLSDSHIKVQKAGAQALKQIGSVIRNPEIQAIVPVLLQALQDPASKTATSLQTLLDTKFVHFIDAPSLALIMPVVQRAFMDRSTETRKMAAQIIGNMYSLTDQKDLCPYLPTIIPGLKTSLLDPVPEVRSVSARALGAMVRGMGETSFEDLLPWLMQTLTSETSSVDRSGAAQGLSEVVGGLGVEKLHKLMPDIIATAERTDIAPHVKDGYIMMFIYMPVVFMNEFTPYIGQIINPILKALADENEYVRDTALKAGQRIVNLYAENAIMLLLPQLEQGLFDDNWRIRYSSVQLLGDLLYRISGVSGKMSTETADEDDNFGTEQSHKAIIEALGAERRNRVLAGLYMGRSDVALMVRQSALHVWKVVVTNTPRTLREILPTLFSLLLGCLASTSLDKRQVAARTLGDLVRKLGERVLPEIIPILERGLESDAADQRQGVCIGLSEIMASTSRDMVLTFVNSLVPTVRKALCDPLPEVRHAAAKTFDSLHSTVGVRALDDILPAMLLQLNSPDQELAECTLDGLRQVMAIKSRVVLPYLVPQLTAPPVNTKALSMLACVAGEALTKYLPKILPALLAALSSAQGTPRQAEELKYCQAVVLSVTDEVGIRTIVDQLMENTRSEKVELRISATTLLCAFCANTRADYSQYVPQLLRGLIHLFTDSNAEVLQMSWEALSAVTKTLDATQQAAHVGDVRQAVRFTASDLKGSDLLPGFCLPKGITPILPIFREAILNGAPEIKEQAAQGLGEVIKLTSAQALQPSVVHITGPLIRIVGDRFNWTVKAAVLETLALLLAKVGVMLKQFLPQLQTTFLKALNDSNRTVRLKAANALGHLIVIHTRADPLFIELHTGVKSADDPAIRETMLQALRGVITPAGEKMSLALRKQVYATLTGLLNHSEDATRSAAAGCLGALVKYLPPELLASTVTEHLLNDDAALEWTLRHGRSSALYVALKEAPDIIYAPECREKVNKVVLAQLAVDRVPIAMNGVRSCGYLFQHLMLSQEQLPQQLLTPFVRTMNHTSNEVKQLLARVCAYLARAVPAEFTSPEYLRLAIPMLVNGTKEKNGYVKANSELALVSVLGLRVGDSATQTKCLGLLDIGAKESLSDVITKVLKKVALLPEGKEEDLDDTILT